MNKKRSYRKVTRMIIALLCCFPIFLVIAALMKGADDFLILLCNLVVGGTILFLTYLIGEKQDIKREELHNKLLEEIKERKMMQRLTRNYGDLPKDTITINTTSIDDSQQKE